MQSIEFPTSEHRLSLGLVNQRLEALGVGAEHLLDLVAALKEHERGHSTDAKLGRDVGDGVDVNLGEVHRLLEVWVLGVPLEKKGIVRSQSLTRRGKERGGQGERNNWPDRRRDGVDDDEEMGTLTARTWAR